MPQVLHGGLEKVMGPHPKIRMIRPPVPAGHGIRPQLCPPLPVALVPLGHSGNNGGGQFAALQPVAVAVPGEIFMGAFAGGGAQAQAVPLQVP